MDLLDRTIDQLKRRQPEESAPAHAARIVFLSLGPCRTIKEVGAMPEYKPGSARGWSKTHHWSGDALLYDEANARQALERSSEENQRRILKMNEIIWEIVETELGSCKQAAKEASKDPLGYVPQRKQGMDIVRCGATIIRLISDRPTQIMDVRHGTIDPTILSDEQLDMVADGGPGAVDELMAIAQRNVGKSVGVTTAAESVTASVGDAVTGETDAVEPVKVSL